MGNEIKPTDLSIRDFGNTSEQGRKSSVNTSVDENGLIVLVPSKNAALASNLSPRDVAELKEVGAAAVFQSLANDVGEDIAMTMVSNGRLASKISFDNAGNLTHKSTVNLRKMAQDLRNPKSKLRRAVERDLYQSKITQADEKKAQRLVVANPSKSSRKKPRPWLKQDKAHAQNDFAERHQNRIHPNLDVAVHVDPPSAKKDNAQNAPDVQNKHQQIPRYDPERKRKDVQEREPRDINAKNDNANKKPEVKPQPKENSGAPTHHIAEDQRKELEQLREEFDAWVQAERNKELIGTFHKAWNGLTDSGKDAVNLNALKGMCFPDRKNVGINLSNIKREHLHALYDASMHKLAELTYDGKSDQLKKPSDMTRHVIIPVLQDHWVPEASA